MMNYCQSSPLPSTVVMTTPCCWMGKMNLCPLQGKGAEFVAQNIRDFTALNFSMFWPLETTHLAGFSSEACIITIVIKFKKNNKKTAPPFRVLGIRSRKILFIRDLGKSLSPKQWNTTLGSGKQIIDSKT